MWASKVRCRERRRSFINSLLGDGSPVSLRDVGRVGRSSADHEEAACYLWLRSVRTLPTHGPTDDGPCLSASRVRNVIPGRSTACVGRRFGLGEPRGVLEKEGLPQVS